MKPSVVTIVPCAHGIQNVFDPFSYDRGHFASRAQGTLVTCRPVILCWLQTRLQNNLGVMYANGKGVIQNDVEALKWHRLAAGQGDIYAQSNVGSKCAAGKGVNQNNVIAHMWYNISSANGHEDAAKWRDDIALKMTREAIEKAQEMAQECMSSGYKNCGD